MVNCNQHFSLHDLRRAEDLIKGLNRCTRNARFVQDCDPLVAGPAEKNLRQNGDQRLSVFNPIRIPRKARILRQLNLADGQDTAAPEKFLPSNGKPYALNLFNNTIYTATAQGCGGVPNGYYSFDLATRRTSVFLPAGGGMWGRRGVAIAPDGTLFMGTGDAPFNPTTRTSS